MAGFGRLTPFDGGVRRHLDPWHDAHCLMERPLRIGEQFFGNNLLDEDLFRPIPFRGWYVRPRRKQASETQESSGSSQMEVNDKEFRVNLDVTHFKPEEISIKTVDDRVVVHGKHEERQDEHGFVQREFTRAYALPQDVNPTDVKSSLSADGVLTIVAPKCALGEPNERSVPIEMTPAGETPKLQE